MRVQRIQIVGRSVSGYATTVALPEYSLCFDLGMATHEAVQAEYLAITHGHLDHFGGLARHGYIRGMTGMHVPKYIVPPWLKASVGQTFEFWSKVQQSRRAPHASISLSSGESLDIGHRRILRPFDTVHRVPSQGYTLCEQRKRLKPEYQGLSGHELGKMRRDGVEFEDTFEHPLVSFTGDTEARVFDQVPDRVLKSDVLILECTFLSDVSEKEAIKKGHTHIDQLARRADQFADVKSLVLIHFSKRYRNRDVEEAVSKLPEALRVKTTFLPLAK